MNFCLDQNDEIPFMNSLVFTIPCHGEGGNQYWWLKNNWYLMRDYQCVGVLEDRLSVAVMDCGRVKPWRYDKKKRRIEQDGKCLSVGSNNNIYAAQMLPCREGDPLQEWVFSKFSYQGIKYEDLANEALIQT